MEPLFTPEFHVFYEQTKVPLAIYYIENGRFKTYLVSEGACEMYESTREEILERLNGDDPLCNIVEKEEMGRVIRSFSENDERYNVVFHEYIGKDRKLKTLHGVGHHEFTRDGRRYSIVRYDEISDSSRRFLFKDEEKEMAEREKLIADIDDAIARSYTAVLYFDTHDQSLHYVRHNRFGKMIREEVDSDPHLRHFIDVYVRLLVYKDDADEVLRFGDFDYVMDRLKTSNPLFHTYRTIRDGRMVYYRLKIIPFDNGTKLIYGFEYFDDQVRERIARQTEHETQMTLLAGLTCEYESVWLVDAAIHHGKLIRNNMKKSAMSDILHRFTEGNYETILGNYIDHYIVAEDRERVYLMSSIDNLMRNTKEDEIYHINYCRIDPAGVRNYIQLSVARVTDEKGVVRFVCGFRNIDAIIEEEKNRNMLYSMAHIDHMTNVNNRRTFDEHMDSKQDADISEDLVFFSFDLNELKEANDSHGHEAGDELIIGASDCMKEVLGPFGKIYRTGGDEFAAIVHIPAGQQEETVRRLQEAFRNWKGKLYPSLSISMGYIAATEDPAMTIDEMRRESEKRMYAMKSDHYMKEGNDRRRRNYG